MKVAFPEQWVEPTLRQAWADFLVAAHLAGSRLKGMSYGGSFPCDASMDKLQQALEKLLKGLILKYHPNRSDLMFTHWYITSVKADIQKIAMSIEMNLNTDLLSNKDLRTVENLAPSGEVNAILDQAGDIVELPENTQYPHTIRSKRGKVKVVSPCEQMSLKYGKDLMRRIKEVLSLFKLLLNANDLSVLVEGSSLFQEFRGFKFE